MDIFEYSSGEQLQKDSPLARRMSPRSLDEFCGQEHLLGEGKPLRKAIEGDLLSSFIFYGPPGSGKTALARIIARTTRASFVRLNAASAGVKEVRAVLEEAEANRRGWGRKTILFIDELHRFNKAQQDALLAAVEEGTIYFIGATTENPFISVIPPLVSRMLLFTFESLSDEDINCILQRALQDEERGLGGYRVTIDEQALQYLAGASGGDARVALNTLEMAVVGLVNDEKAGPGDTLSLEQVHDVLQRKYQRHDPGGDYHYDVVSAFIKSIRGSDPDAALYWLARMLEAGEDPLFIARRLVISASEDIGNADPRALCLAAAAAQAVQQVGLPEGRIPLAQAAAYLAAAPKSNAAYIAVEKALQEVRNNPNRPVPPALRDASYKGASRLGHGRGYLYPHDFPGHFVPQQYLPEGLQKKVFYRPAGEGYEKEILERLRRWRDLTGREGE